MAKTGTTIDELLQALDQLDTKEDGQMCTKNYNSRRRESSSFRERELKGKIEGSPGRNARDLGRSLRWDVRMYTHKHPS